MLLLLCTLISNVLLNLFKPNFPLTAVSPSRKQLSSSFPLAVRHPCHSADHQKELQKQQMLETHNPPFPAAGVLPVRGGVGCSISLPMLSPATLRQRLPPGWVRCRGHAPECRRRIRFCGVNPEWAGLNDTSAGV